MRNYLVRSKENSLKNIGRADINNSSTPTAETECLGRAALSPELKSRSFWSKPSHGSLNSRDVAVVHASWKSALWCLLEICPVRC